MTFCEVLKHGMTASGKHIVCTKCTDKYSTIDRYEITVFGKDGIEIFTIPTARTTWKKKYNAEQASN